MPYIIAITGGICSGKSVVSQKLLYKTNIPIIDSDLISKKITLSDHHVLKKIKQYFGSKILLSNGLLNRQALKKQIFTNSIDRKWLEKLLHPLIKKEITKTIYNLSKYDYVIWVTPLLIENNLQKHVNRILVIDTHPDIQLTRLMYRDKIDKKYAQKIVSTQISRNFRLKFADEIIENNSTLHKLTEQINKISQNYQNKSKQIKKPT